MKPVVQGQHMVSGNPALPISFLGFTDREQGSGPKGALSYRMKGMFVRSSLHPSVHPSVHPLSFWTGGTGPEGLG